MAAKLVTRMIAAPEKLGRSGLRSVPLIVSLGLLLSWAGGSCIRLAARDRAPGPRIEKGMVLFRYYAPEAFRVQVAGDWPRNNWARGDGAIGEANVGLMKDEDGDGVWELAVKLPPGRYRYLFLVDEDSWRLDPGNPDEVEGGPVGRCSRLVILEREGKMVLR